MKKEHGVRDDKKPGKPEVKTAAKVTAFGEKLVAELETAKTTGTKQEARAPEKVVERDRKIEKAKKHLKKVRKRREKSKVKKTTKHAKKRGKQKKHPSKRLDTKKAKKAAERNKAKRLKKVKKQGETEKYPPELEAEESKEEEREIRELPGYARKTAEVVEPHPEEEFLWLEVRPFLGQQLRVTNYLELINSMYGTGGMFEFVMAAGPDPSDIDRAVHPKRVVRYFIKCPDLVSKELAKNTLQTTGFAVEECSLKLKDGKLLWREPDYWVEYPAEAELELETHYGSKPLFPETLTYERSFEQFVKVIDSLHAALLSGGAFRIAVRRNDKAVRYIHIPTVSRDGRTVGGAMSYHLSSFLENFMRFGRPDGASHEEIRVSQPLDWKTQQEINRRISQSWFTCDARAYGTPDQIRAIEASLGFPSNRFRVFRYQIFRYRKRSKPVDPSLQELKSFLRRGAILSPLAFPVLLWWIGLWYPLDILKNTTLVWPLGLALILPFVIRSLWRIRNTIAMTVGELSLLVSMPNKPEAGHFYFAEGKPRVEIKAEPLVRDTSQEEKKESQESRTPRAALYLAEG